jgi:dUTP pyrophosphatase
VIELPIVRLREDARIPERAYAGDAGLDLVTCEPLRLGPGERAVVHTGVAVAIPEGFAGFVQPRSGLAARHGIAVVNSPGLIDSGYRGEIRVVLLNTDREHAFVAAAGERIAQLVVLPVPELELVELDELPATERGVRGFGSSRT